jgi:hypothetical protein
MWLLLKPCHHLFINFAHPECCIVAYTMFCGSSNGSYSGATWGMCFIFFCTKVFS